MRYLQNADPINRSLHLSVLYLKRYIYTCNSFEKKSNFLEFRKKIITVASGKMYSSLIICCVLSHEKNALYGHRL